MLKISAFRSYEKEELVIRRKDEGYRLRKQKSKMERRVIAEHFSIGKICVSNILRNAKTLQREYKFFKGNCKKARHGQYHLINEILIAWYNKCASANVFPDDPC